MRYTNSMGSVVYFFRMMAILIGATFVLCFAESGDFEASVQMVAFLVVAAGWIPAFLWFGFGFEAICENSINRYDLHRYERLVAEGEREPIPVSDYNPYAYPYGPPQGWVPAYGEAVLPAHKAPFTNDPVAAYEAIRQTTSSGDVFYTRQGRPMKRV